MPAGEPGLPVAPPQPDEVFRDGRHELFAGGRLSAPRQLRSAEMRLWVGELREVLSMWAWHAVEANRRKEGDEGGEGGDSFEFELGKRCASPTCSFSRAKSSCASITACRAAAAASAAETSAPAVAAVGAAAAGTRRSPQLPPSSLVRFRFAPAVARSALALEDTSRSGPPPCGAPTAIPAGGPCASQSCCRWATICAASTPAGCEQFRHRQRNACASLTSHCAHTHACNRSINI